MAEHDQLAVPTVGNVQAVRRSSDDAHLGDMIVVPDLRHVDGR
jgi:hypothetical protein